MISNFFYWYYVSGLVGSVMSFVLLYIAPVILLASVAKYCWDVEKFDCDVIESLLALGFFVPIGCVALVGLWPLILVILFMYLFSWVFFKWGKNYKALVKSQEAKKLSALAELIKEDSDVKAAYERIMKETQKI